MKRMAKKLLALGLSGAMLVGLIPVSASEVKEVDTMKIYVSPLGNDSYSGTQDNPLKTLQAARDAARSADNAEIVLRGGEYVLGETLVLDGQDSNVKWTNYPGEVPVVTSAMPITGWEIHDSEKNIYKASVPKGFNTRQLYFNGEKAKRSRNISYEGGYSNLKRTCELGIPARDKRELYFYADDIQSWDNFEDVEIHLLTAWVDNVLRLKKYEENNCFKATTVDNGGNEGVVNAAAVKIQDIEEGRIFNRAHPDITGSTLGYASRSYFYLENAYEFIDEDTEWYLNRKTDTVYFKAPKGTDMNSVSVTVPTLETLVKIEGTKNSKASGITFENIVFECSSWTKPSDEGVVGAQACQYTLKTNLKNETYVYHPAAGFFAEYADKLLVKGCTFRKMGAFGIDFYTGVTDSRIYDNDVYDVAASGISVAKFVQDEETEYHNAYNPADKSEITSGIDVVNNIVHDIGTEYEGAVGIIAGYPENIVIAHNNIYNAPYSGISVGFGWSSSDNAMKNNVIFANKIDSIGQVLCDFGAIYTLSKQPGSVCARNYINNVKRKSWFDYGYAGMYFDEQTEGYTIADNVIRNLGTDSWKINFNGCASKNTSKTNYINQDIVNGVPREVYEQSGIKRGIDSELLAKAARKYRDDTVSLSVAKDPTDYDIYAEITPVGASATKADSTSSAAYAIDKDDSTVYSLSNQTESSMKDEYLTVELDGKTVVNKIVIYRQFNAGSKTSDNSYWADCCLAVGCELQGSMDGKEWEKLGDMDPWPDGLGQLDSETIELENPKAYKYIRYIRTKYKTGDDYGVWRWRDSDGGNRLNVQEIEFYSAQGEQVDEQPEEALYEKGSFVNSYNPIISRYENSGTRAWRDGFVAGNGLTGYVTSGEPYSDAFIFQHMFFNFPTDQPRYVPSELTGQLEDARLNVFNLNDKWEIKDANGNKRRRTFFYSYHPGAQLRLTSAYKGSEKDYIRWTNYETAETGVKFTDKYGTWKRVSFTSRPDDVTITKIEKSSKGELVNMTVSIDDIDDMAKGWDGFSAISKIKYKRIVPDDCSYVSQLVHYPAYNGSELYDGGYGSVTYVIAEGENAKKTRVVLSSDESYFVGENAAVKIENAEAVYLITVVDRTFEMTGQKTGDVMTKFVNMTSYPFLDGLVERAKAVKDKYSSDGKFSYEAALAPSAKLQKEKYNSVSFELEGDEEYAEYDNNSIISLQRGKYDSINHEFMRRAYNQARFAQICCGGASAPRLYGMWTGEWSPGWRGIYTLDANVNLQVSAMNTGNLGGEFQYGYITYFLRHSADFMENARMAYGMHDAIQPSVNTDADRAMHVEYDNAYPFEYWNAGASWCLLPIFEYWQCYGNQKIAINDNMRFESLQKVLGVNDGGLTDEEYNEIKERGYLDLEKDILLPLLTKQANFWEQIVTPRYYTDVNGKACHDESKTELNEGEKYIIIPTYSPENNPIGYYSTITANATMDIAAARDGLDMVCTMEKAVGRDGWEEAAEKWQSLKNLISDYKLDKDGALREWAMDEYTENNNHRHLSHLYVAWPAYDTQNDPELAKAANKALDNRNKFNTGDATAGHGWMHKALVEARLKRGDGMMKSLLKMMNGTAYYSSMMTDHDTNRRNDTYCTDTAFGTLGAVNESIVFSNTGQIEIIPALPKDWKKGSVKGLMARTRVEVSDITWDIDNGFASTALVSSEDNNTIRLSCGEAWTNAVSGGKELEIKNDENGNYVEVTLNKDELTEVEFTLSAAPNGTYTITKDGKYLKVDGYENGSETVWGSLDSKAYWNVENTDDGFILIRSTFTGKYLTDENGVLVQMNLSEDKKQKFNADDFDMNRLDYYTDVTITPDRIVITANGEETDLLELNTDDKIKLSAKVEPEGASTTVTWATDSIGNGVILADGTLKAYEPGEFNVIAQTDSGFTTNLAVRVSGPSNALQKAQVINIAAADDGYNGAWIPQNAFDGKTGSAYSSKDDAKVKYISAELNEPEAINTIYVTGRFTGADGSGAFSNRINGAKIYASNEQINADAAKGVLVGEVSGVSATSEYIPARVEIDTKGEKYKFYTIYFDKVNNGSNISMAVDDIAFYTGGQSFVRTLTPKVTAFGGENPEYATDGKTDTAFVIGNQTEGAFANQYIQFDFEIPQVIYKMVVKKQIATLGGNKTYWADHAYAAGCAFEGSIDGENWETIYTMNTKPDGTDSTSEIIIQPNKAYRYIRYIRKEKNGYVSWAENAGNKLILADIEFYKISANVITEIVSNEKKAVTVRVKSNVSGEFNLITAIYDNNERLIEVVTTHVVLEEGEANEVVVNKEKEGKVRIFAWGDHMLPLAKKITA